MQNDSKFGLLVGVALVVAVAVVFFLRQTPPSALPAAVESPKAVESKPVDPRPSAAAMLPPPAALTKPDRQTPTRTVSIVRE